MSKPQMKPTFVIGLGHIPNDWSINSVNSLCTLKGRIGWRGYTKEDLTDSGPLVIGATQINSSNRLDFSKPVYISKEKFDESPEIQVSKGDIILVKTGNTIGKVAYIDQDIGEATINPNTALLKDIKCNPKFLFYVLSSSFIKKRLLNLVTVGAQPSINQASLKAINIGMPNPKEQQKIASILASVDEAIEKTELILKKSEKITNSVTKKLLTSGIDHEVLKSTRLGELPNNWEVIALKELASINMGQSPPSVDVHDYEKGIPFYQGNADFGEMNPSPRKWCDKPKKIANSNDILFSVRAPVGEMNIAIEECCIGRGLASITPREVSPSFLYYLLLFYRKDLKRAAQGSTFTAINKNDLVNLELPLPKKEEQEKITIILDTLWNKKQIELSKLNELKNLKKGLIQQLLTGKVRVPTTESEEVPQ